MRRLRAGSEAGYAVVAALWVLLIVGLLGSAALAFSLRSIHTSQGDRDARWRSGLPTRAPTGRAGG